MSAHVHVLYAESPSPAHYIDINSSIRTTMGQVSRRCPLYHNTYSVQQRVNVSNYLQAATQLLSAARDGDIVNVILVLADGSVDVNFTDEVNSMPF